jgi:hypothetical protein
MATTYLQAVRQFFVAVTQQTVTVVTGTLFTVAGWFWEAIAALFPALENASLPGWVLWIPGHILIFYGAFLAWKDEYDAKQAVEDSIRPRVRLHHEFNSVPNYLRVANMGPGVQERRHIIGIENLSSVQIQGLRIVAESFEPYLQGATWVDAPMHPLRAPIDNEGRFDLSVGEGHVSRFAEVFQELVFPQDTTRPPLLTFVYDQSGLNQLKRFIVGNWFAVTLRIQGSVKPERIRLVAKVNPATHVWDVRESNEAIPANHGCQVAQLVSTAVTPPTEPVVGEAMPSHAVDE